MLETTREMVVIPDGSGKVTITFSLADENHQKGFTAAEAAAFMSQIGSSCSGDEGISAYSVGTVEVDGKTSVRLKLYVQEISGHGISFRKLADGFVLESPAPAPGADWNWMRDTYTLPGEIKSTEGATSIKGRTVTFDGSGKSFPRRIVCGPSQVSQEAMAELKREAAAAKNETAQKALPRAKALIKDQPAAGLSALEDLVRRFADTKPAQEAKTLIGPLRERVAAERERVAADLLQVAEKLIQTKPADAERNLSTIIIQYADTPAGKRARELVKVATSAKLEQLATVELANAERLISRNPDAAKRRLKQIVEKYPGTKSAERARELLEELK